MRVTVGIGRIDYHSSGIRVWENARVEMEVAHFKDVLTDGRVLKHAHRLTPELLDRIATDKASVSWSGHHYTWSMSNESEQQTISVWKE